MREEGGKGEEREGVTECGGSEWRPAPRDSLGLRLVVRACACCGHDGHVNAFQGPHQGHHNTTQLGPRSTQMVRKLLPLLL